MAKVSIERRNEKVAHIAGLVVLNAMIFQEILSGHEQEVHPLSKLMSGGAISSKLSDHWDHITTNINYYPIFHIAREILDELSSSTDIDLSLRALASTAQEIVSKRAALRHDLMGRVYHKLLADAKYLGTYYTSIPSAALILKLCTQRLKYRVDWSDLQALEQLRIADLACGTGTLLVAAAEAVVDNHISACVENSKSIDLAELHRVLVQHVLHGYDVLPSAIHLTASSLALRAPEIRFRKMNLFSMPLGGNDAKLGSIEFLRSKRVGVTADLFGSVEAAGKTVSSEGEAEVLSASLPDLDLCVINPPFTRSVGGNLLFGSLPAKERAVMQKDLQKMIKSGEVLANITAGLGPVFVATADNSVKKGGFLALILPKALLSGVSWGPTRKLLARNYVVEYIICSHDPRKWSFSESTSLSEVLLIARKRATTSPEDDALVNTVNLWKNPDTAVEALALANEISKIAQKEAIEIGDHEVAQALTWTWKDLKARDNWILPAAFAQRELTECVTRLDRQGELKLPGSTVVDRVPLCPLSQLTKLGPDVRDIADGFRLSKSKTSYPVLKGHKSSEVLSLRTQTNGYLVPLKTALPGRTLKKHTDLWPLAGSIVLAERLRLNTHRIVACLLNKTALATSWWTLSPHSELSENQLKALVLWLNSCLGVAQIMGIRVETEGAWIKLKKPSLLAMPVLDVRELGKRELTRLAKAYDKLQVLELAPIANLEGDSVRAQVDNAIVEALGMSSLESFRAMLGREPILTSKSLIQL